MVTTKRIRLKDIAEQAGVSVALVSYVMSEPEDETGERPNKYRVNANTRKKIREIAKELGYQPNTAARMLRSGNSKVVGVILNDISNVFYGEVARCLEDITHKAGYTLLIGSTDEDAEKFSFLVQSFISRGVDGMVVFPCSGCDNDMRLIEKLKIPVVVMDRKDVKIEAPTFVLDGENAMKLGVGILRAKGVKDIEMISSSVRVSSITDREAGYIEAVGKDKARIHILDFYHSTEDARKLLPDLVSRGVKGLVNATNDLAVAIIKEMLAHDMRPGVDIYLVGFDKDNIYNIYPPIPHILQPVKEMCTQAFTSLRDIMEGRAPQEYSLVVFDCIPHL